MKYLFELIVLCLCSTWLGNHTDEWNLVLRDRQFGLMAWDYDGYYHILYDILEQILPLGVIPLVLLAYFNKKIHAAIKLPPNIELQGDEEMACINREKRLSRVLMRIVIVFIVCHTPRITWYIYNATNYKSIVYCALQNPTNSGLSPWSGILGLLYDMFIVINSSVNTIVYCTANDKFRRNFLSFIFFPCRNILRRINYYPTFFFPNELPY